MRLTTSQRQVMSGADHGAPSRPQKPSAAQADATLLRCQLDPISTPQLRGRLDRLFGQPTHPDEVDRQAVLSRLVEAYSALGARTVLRMRGVLPRADAPMAALLAELRATSFPSGAQRERPKVRAEGYMVLARPHNGAAASEAVHASEADPRGAEACGEAGEAGGGGGGGGEGGGGGGGGGEGGGGEGGGSGVGAGGGGGGDGGGSESNEGRAHHSEASRLAATKLRRHARLWNLAHEIVAGIDPPFARQYTAIALTKQFEGSPHIDTENVAPFYGLSLGDFTGGAICVESGLAWSSAPSWRRQTWPPTARGAPTLTRGSPVRSGAEPWPFGPRSAALEPLPGANNSAQLAAFGHAGGPLEVTSVDTRGRLGKIDGRYPHWVAPHVGERYSVIYYVSNGPVVPQGPAVLCGEEMPDQ